MATNFLDLEKNFHYLAFRQAWKLTVKGWRSASLEVGGNGKIADLRRHRAWRDERGDAGTRRNGETEIRGRRKDDRRKQADCSWQTAAGRNQGSEIRRQKSEVRGRRTEDRIIGKG